MALTTVRLQVVNRTFTWNCFCIPQRFVMTILIFFGLFNVYTLRNTLAVAIVQMRQKKVVPELIWNMSSQDVILTSFFPLYVIANIFGGSIAERYGSKLVFGLGILCTSLVTLFIPIAAYQGYAYLMVVRVFQGLFEGLTIPVSYTIYGKWFPKTERTILRTCCEAGFDVGFLAGQPLTGFLCDTGYLDGWPLVFYFFGGIAIIWCILWWAFAYESPATHPWISNEEKNYIISSQGDEIARERAITPWGSILTSPVILSLAVAAIISGIFVQFIRQDYPTYLNSVYGFEILQVGWLTMLPQALDLVSSVLSSFLADFIIIRTHGKHRTLIRKAFNVASAVPTAAAQLALLFCGDRPYVVIGMMTMAYGLGGLDACGSGSIPVDVSPVFAGTVFGLLNALGNVSAIISPVLIGTITSGHEKSQARWNIIFIISFVTNIVSTIIFVIFASADLQPWGLEGDPCCMKGPRRSRTMELQDHPRTVVETVSTYEPYVPMSTDTDQHVGNMKTTIKEALTRRSEIAITSLSTPD